MSGLARNNDVAINGVNGGTTRIGNKTWCKCECCVPVETSVEGVCWLEITEICKRRFSSCLNVCRSDPHFVSWCSRRENFISYLISIQCWSLANQNKSFLSLQTSWLSVFCKTFYLINHIFFFIRDVCFCERIFSKEHPIGFRGLVIIEKQYLIVRPAKSSHSQVLKNLLNGGELYGPHFPAIWKNISD